MHVLFNHVANETDFVLPAEKLNDILSVWKTKDSSYELPTNTNFAVWEDRCFLNSKLSK